MRWGEELEDIERYCSGGASYVAFDASGARLRCLTRFWSDNEKEKNWNSHVKHLAKWGWEWDGAHYSNEIARAHTHTHTHKDNMVRNGVPWEEPLRVYFSVR